jgi:hypothetical protein
MSSPCQIGSPQTGQSSGGFDACTLPEYPSSLGNGLLQVEVETDLV